MHAINPKKNSCSSKIPLPPNNFSNGPSLRPSCSEKPQGGAWWRLRIVWRSQLEVGLAFDFLCDFFGWTPWNVFLFSIGLLFQGEDVQSATTKEQSQLDSKTTSYTVNNYNGFYADPGKSWNMLFWAWKNNWMRFRRTLRVPRARDVATIPKVS